MKLPLINTISLAILLVAQTANAITIEVSAGGHDRVAAPVIFQLPQGLRKAEALKLVDVETGRPVAVQVLPQKPPKAVWIERGLVAGEKRTYRLTAAEPGTNSEPTVTCSDDGARLTVRVGDRPVLSYNHAELPAPEGIDPVFAKSGHIHPMQTPSGRLVTDDFPPDHAHQHGIFFAWVNTTFEDRRVDFWNQAGKSGRIEHLNTVDMMSGPVFAQFIVRLRHSDLTAPGEPKPVLHETWTVRVYNVADSFLVDLTSQQRCVAETPLTINEYHYGGMALRGARQWFEQPESGFLTDGGRTRQDGNHTRARWVIAHGISDGQPANLLVMGHPDNFRAPQHVRLHPTKPYFCFAPMVLGSFEIAPGTTYTSRYRYASSDGAPDAPLAKRLWQDFAEPPAVEVRREK